MVYHYWGRSCNDFGSILDSEEIEMVLSYESDTGFNRSTALQRGDLRRIANIRED